MATAGLSIPDAHADCDPRRADVLPLSGATIPTNPQLIISVGLSHTTLDGFELALSSDSDEVPLVVVDHVTSYDLAQFLVRPERDLEPGTTYQLMIQGPRRLRGQDAMELWSWTTGTGPDHTEPTWEDPPSVLSRGYFDECCGWVMAGVLTPVVDDSELILMILGVEPEPWSGPGQHIVPVLGGQVVVGRSACDGGFGFDLETEYQINFAAIDLAGNRAEAPGTVVVQFSDIGLCGADCD